MSEIDWDAVAEAEIAMSQLIKRESSAAKAARRLTEKKDEQ